MELTLDLDDDGYPTDETLVSIEQAPIRSRDACAELLRRVREIWQYADCGFWHEERGLFKISTGGWSGNESIVAALQANLMFWTLCWESSRRGGHFEFEAVVSPQAPPLPQPAT